MATVKVLRFKPELCKGERECERACSQVHFKTDNGGEFSALTITEGENGYQMEVCNHCGLCIDMCPVLAIKRISNGNVIINKKTCIGCQSCVGFCPRNGVRKAPEKIVPFKCISCGKCVEACPNNALELVEVELDELEEVVYHKQGVCE